jgi:hypothetical protein
LFICRRRTPQHGVTRIQTPHHLPLYPDRNTKHRKYRRAETRKSWRDVQQAAGAAPFDTSIFEYYIMPLQNSITCHAKNEWNF